MANIGGPFSRALLGGGVETASARPGLFFSAHPPPGWGLTGELHVEFSMIRPNQALGVLFCHPSLPLLRFLWSHTMCRFVLLCGWHSRTPAFRFVVEPSSVLAAHALSLREIINMESSYSRCRVAIMVKSCLLWLSWETHCVFFLRVAEPPSTHPLCDTPSRYDVMATLSYAVEFIVCTAADYRCLTCRAGDLKRQRRSQHCIRLARKARGMLGSLGYRCVLIR